MCINFFYKINKTCIAGFGLCGMPENLIQGLVKTGQKELFVISSNAGTSNHGLGPLLKQNMVSIQTDKSSNQLRLTRTTGQ